MSQRTSNAPAGWQVAAEVDSRLEADLAARLLAARGVEAAVVERGADDFAVYVAAGDIDAAGQVLDPG
jgi:hypothetical protein